MANLKSQFSTAGGILDPTSLLYWRSVAASPQQPEHKPLPLRKQPLPEIQGPPPAFPKPEALIGEPTFSQQVASAAENVGQSVSEIQASGMGLKTKSMTDAGNPKTSSRPVAECLAGSRESILDSGLGRQFGLNRYWSYVFSRPTVSSVRCAVGLKKRISSSVLDKYQNPFVLGQAAPDTGIRFPQYAELVLITLFTGGQAL